jgi:tetratricopeptide (TPR) repeat protein
MRAGGICILLAFGLLAGERSWSANAIAQEHFSEASAAYDAEDFSKARALFEQALADGMNGPAIHFNIGSAAYLGGDLPRAERAFREVARTPAMASLAYYNLGLIALERRDESEARDWFERAIHDATPDARLQALTLQRLEELPDPRGPGQWYYYTRGGIGYDDNVALRSASFESSATGEADAYGEFVLATTYSIGQWRLDTGASLLQYQSLHAFNQNSYYLGGARGFRTDKWYFELGATGSQASLGGDVYEQNVAAGGQATRMFLGGGRLRAQVRGTSVQGQGAFTGLTGKRMELGLYYDKRWRRWDFGVHTRAEKDDSEDPIFASRWFQLGGDAGYAFSPLWNVELSASMRRTSHPAQSETISGWDDRRATLLVGITRTLWERTQLFLRYVAERSNSAVAGYDYDRNWVAVSVENWR